MSRIWHKFFVCVTVALVLLGSCPVKASIKNLMGIPVNKEQRAPQNHIIFQVTGVEKCADVKIAATKIVQINSTGIGTLLPTAALALIFNRLPSFVLTDAQPHPHYGHLKIPGALPVFLQCRSLII